MRINVFLSSLLIFNGVKLSDAIPQIATAKDCSEAPSPIIGCTKTDPPFIAVTYPDGPLKCGYPLTIEQASKEPLLSAIIDEPNDYYTILLVDTSDSFMHPILHYGATNVLGSDLLQQFNLTEANPFSAYRGPAPPSYIPGIRCQQFNYEWLVSKQSSFADAPPVVDGNTKFNYTGYLNAVNATMLSSTYFSSGFCVKDVNDMSSGDESCDESGDNPGNTGTSGTSAISTMSFTALTMVALALLL